MSHSLGACPVLQHIFINSSNLINSVRGSYFNSSILISSEPGAFLFLNCVRADNNSSKVIGSILSSFDATGNKSCSLLVQRSL
jgi:hypothetical protein